MTTAEDGLPELPDLDVGGGEVLSGEIVVSSVGKVVARRRVSDRPEPPNALKALTAAGYDLVVSGVSANTLRAYERCWGQFNEYLDSRKLGRLDIAPTPATVIIDWMALMLRTPTKQTKIPMAPSSVSQMLAAIRYKHREIQGSDKTWTVPQSLLLTQAYRGYCHQWLDMGHRVQQAEPTSWEDLEVYAAGIDTSSPRGKRDLALILLSFWMAARASDISALWTSPGVDNIRLNATTMQLFLPYSKTDQAAAGQWVTIPKFDKNPPLCPVRSVQAWRAELLQVRPEAGKLFVEMPAGLRSDFYAKGFPGLQPMAVSDVTKRWARRLGLGQRSAHSHRRGAATRAHEAGADIPQIKKLGRWKSSDTVMKYIDDQAFEHPLA